MISKDTSTCGDSVCPLELLGKIGAIEKVIPQDETTRMPGQKFFGNQQCLGYPLRLLLHRITKSKPPLPSVS
ncbi:hypothetical protein JM66_10480 [Aeromonas bestiarum]|nr:hypothetical protein JM66_10480 [Aeromonas bestiarum]